MIHRWGTAAIITAAVLAGGCGKVPPPPIVEAEGVVLLNGKPLPKAEVKFIPKIEYGAEYIAKGVTDEKGRFKLTCKGEPGACACENIVVIADQDIPPKLLAESAQAELAKYLKSLPNRPIPPQYASAAGTPLRATVTADKKEYTFTLER